MTPDQLTLPTARRTDPETSHRAAASIGRGVEEAVMRTHQMFSHLGGMTDDQLVSLMEKFHPPTVKSARSRLSRRGLLRDSRATRKSARGRDSIVWVVA